jgi:flagellar protein FlaG
MAGDSISALILFIAAIVVAAGVAGVLTVTVGELSASIDSRSDVASDIVSTDVDIISDAGSTAVYDSTTETVTVLVKNTGHTTMNAEAGSIDVLVDGQYVTPTSVSRADGTGDVWASGDVIEVTLDASLDSGEHRISVIVNQNDDTLVIVV